MPEIWDCSFGTGWDYGKRNQWETDVLLGFIPKYSSKKAKVTMTLKQNYMPWSINIGKGFSTEPLACGLYVNTVFGNQFWGNVIRKGIMVSQAKCVSMSLWDNA